MEKNRQTKIIAIVALFIGITILSIGFAMFSARLVIQSKATVTPDADSFKVLLSLEQNSVVVGGVNPTGNGTIATISNSDEPTISNLKANFVNPGEKVVYEFYAVNVGELDAFLNKIEFESVTESGENKVCTAGEDTTDAYVQSACNNIRVTVKVGEDEKACQTSTYGDHKLEKKLGEKVVVTIEYAENGTRADGPFSVAFGDITLNYSTVDTETKNVSECEEYEVVEKECPRKLEGHENVIDNDCNDILSMGDKVTLGTESFYVISTDELANTATMLAEWNLNVGNNTASGTKGIQNETCKGYVYGDSTYYCTIAFSSTTYWNGVVSSYPAWVYNSNSNLYTHVENYVSKLKQAGYNSVTGRLIKYEELVALGCPESGLGTCAKVYSWIGNTDFWSGSAFNSDSVQLVSFNRYFSQTIPTVSTHRGVRPVITINVSEI